MTKNELLTAIQEFVTIIVAHDNTKYNNNSYSIVFDNDIQKVNVPNNGYIKSIDTNNFVTIQFIDNVTTTDWLPLAILDTKIITDIYNVLLEMNSIVNRDRVYVLHCDWGMDTYDKDHSTIGVYHSKEKLYEEFKRFISNDVNNGSWISDFVNEDGHQINKDNMPESYVFTDTIQSAYFYLKYGEKWIEIYFDETFLF